VGKFEKWPGGRVCVPPNQAFAKMSDNNIITPFSDEENNNIIITSIYPVPDGIDYRVMATNLAADIISRRSFGSHRYINRDVLSGDISADICDFIKNDGVRLAYRYLNTINHEIRMRELRAALKPLQRMIGEKLCILLPCFHGQDDGLFDMTATDNYKSIEMDLIEFMMLFITSCALQMADEY
jgi:hypothetical protein